MSCDTVFQAFNLRHSQSVFWVFVNNAILQVETGHTFLLPDFGFKQHSISEDDYASPNLIKLFSEIFSSRQSCKNFLRL
jgi:hypothetical protein